jgi:urea carboxylase-associated protein 1
MLAKAIPGRVLSDEIVAARSYWYRRIPRQSVLRIVDLEGCQSVDTLIYDAERSDVRYNVPNTIKLAKNVYVTRDVVLYDDLAQPLMTVIEDTVGRHDTLAGCCSREINTVRYGQPGNWSCRDNFLAALSQLGMNGRDIPPNINFFMHVPVDGEGGIQISDGISKAGDFVDLRAEKDVLVVISNCPQELNPCCGGRPTPIELVIWQPYQ